MIGMPEVNFGGDSGFAQSIKEVSSEGKRVAVFLSNLVKAAEVDA
jgi:hypothetical protein